MVFFYPDERLKRYATSWPVTVQRRHDSVFSLIAEGGRRHLLEPALFGEPGQGKGKMIPDKKTRSVSLWVFPQADNGEPNLLILTSSLPVKSGRILVLGFSEYLGRVGTTPERIVFTRVTARLI